MIAQIRGLLIYEYEPILAILISVYFRSIQSFAPVVKFDRIRSEEFAKCLVKQHWSPSELLRQILFFPLNNLK